MLCKVLRIPIKKFSASRHGRWLALAGLIAICMAIGLLTFKDFGISWDEPSSYQYGREALSAYRLILSGKEPIYTDSDGVLKYYGAAYLISGAALTSLRGSLGLGTGPGLPIFDWDSLHLLNFVTFLMGVAALYLLLCRWVSWPAAFGAALIFASQPLLWGHAFINPKDIPFMAFFLVSLALGLWMLDNIQTASGMYPVGWTRSVLTHRACVMLAGLALGYATSTRIAAPLAGLIVTVVGLWQSRWKSLPTLALYWIFALLGLYATWPFLWLDPINRFLASLHTMSAFPWKNKILFDGLSYKADNLPWRYLPKLITLQFSEPALLLAGGGLMALVWISWRRGKYRQVQCKSFLLPVILFLWFGVPLGWVILARPIIYDNFRQFLFIMPAIFILGAVALDELFKHLTDPLIRMLIILAAILPGLISGVSLHPYEYVYYNSLAGNIAGHYETDYWATSFREAAGYINSNAPKNAVVSIGPWGLIQDLMRQDIKIDRSNVSANSDYVIIFTRWEYEKNPAFIGKPVYTIGRAGAVFLTIQRMK